MKELLHLDQYQLGIHTPTDGDIRYTRVAARAVLTDDRGRVALMHISTISVYKLPGGGVDDGENIDEGLHREVREETGYQITDECELGFVDEYRYFCGMHQISHAYTARVTRYVGTALTEDEAKRGMELVWVDTLDEAVRLIESGDTVDEEDTKEGLAMMKLRDIAILRSAEELLK